MSFLEISLKLYRQQRLISVLSLLFLVPLLTGAGWYSIHNAPGKPIDTSPVPALPEQLAGSIPVTSLPQPQGVFTQAATLAPFLNIIPGPSDTEVLIEASGVGQLGGTVFANVAIGPGGNKGSYTMPYSDPRQSHLATIIGFTPGQGEEGTLEITTTLGLDSGTTNFYRLHVPYPIPTPINMVVDDLTTTLINSDTLASEAYIAVARSYAPPGPAPAGHYFVSSAYSIRASGALTSTDKPALLRLAYNEAALAGADPHLLAIFAWDAFQKQWYNIGGNPFTSQHYISVPISRFTTYALLATPEWRDEFSELSGLTQFNNITWGGPNNQQLLLSQTPGSGSVLSKPISPTLALARWGELTFSATANPPTTSLTVDVLSLDGTEILTNVSSESSLAALDPAQYPALRLRVNMTSTAAGETPTLDEWRLTWEVEKNKLYLPLIHQGNADTDSVFQINIAPPTPTEANIIQITPSGIWGNACVPRYHSHQVVGESIKIYALIPPPPRYFATIVLPWSFTTKVGPLPTGLYTVKLHITPQGQVEPRFYGAKSFSVVTTAQSR